MIGMIILGVLIVVLAVGSLLTILVASIISVRREPSWHSVCRVAGIGIYCAAILIMGILILASYDIEAGKITAWMVPSLAAVGIAGSSLFAAGYLGQVLKSGKTRITNPPD